VLQTGDRPVHGAGARREGEGEGLVPIFRHE
jgi:hypothetical protein